MNVLLYHIAVLLDFFAFGAGVASVLLIRKRISSEIALLLNLAKIIAGSAIFFILFLSISPKVLIGTGFDLALAYISGVLITAGALRVETNLI